MDSSHKERSREKKKTKKGKGSRVRFEVSQEKAKDLKPAAEVFVPLSELAEKQGIPVTEEQELREAASSLSKLDAQLLDYPKIASLWRSNFMIMAQALEQSQVKYAHLLLAYRQLAAELEKAERKPSDH